MTNNGKAGQETTNSDGVNLIEQQSLDIAPPRKRLDLPDNEEPSRPVKKKLQTASNSSLYLDTVDRHMLDFDFEKLCSVTLSNINIYACLVCGKYFQGKSPSSPAYTHALQESHHVYIHLSTYKVYILPDGYQVHDSSFNDIKYVINPTYTPKSIEQIDSVTAIDINKNKYRPGCIGINNIKRNDYVNAVLQALVQIPPLRNFFLLEKEKGACALVSQFGLLCRKIWNGRAFKPHVSPHELLQEIHNSSEKTFKITEQSDALSFLRWFLNKIHSGLGGSRKKKSLISALFQGTVRVQSQLYATQAKQVAFDNQGTIEESIVPFMTLTLDLPQTPLFQDEFERNIIPQISLDDLLMKYVSYSDTPTHLKKYTLQTLPDYLILHMKRFTENAFTFEKNQTMVNFPLRGLQIPFASGVSTYNLKACICHQGDAKGGKYFSYVYTGKTWYLLEDMIVEECSAQTVFLAEVYVQIWERED